MSRLRCAALDMTEGFLDCHSDRREESRSFSETRKIPPTPLVAKGGNESWEKVGADYLDAL